MLERWLPADLLEWFILPLLATLCVACGWAFRPPSLRSLAHGIVERLILYAILGVIVLSWVGTLLAVAGIFRPWALLSGLLIAWWVVRRALFREQGEYAPAPPEPAPRWAAWVLVALLITAGWTYARPAESFVIPYDAGVYTLGGTVLAHQGKLNAQETFFYSFSEEASFPSYWHYVPKGDPFRERYQEYAHQFYEVQWGFPPRFLKFAGGPFYTWGMERATIEIGFLPLAKVWQAFCVWLFGRAYGPWATPFFGVLGVAACYVLLRRLVGWPTALGAVALLAFSLPQVWFARFPTADIHSQVFWASGLALALLAPKGDERRLGPEWFFWSAFALGALVILRLEGLLLVGLLVGLCALAWAFQKRGGEAIPWLAMTAGTCAVAEILVVLATPLYTLSLSAVRMSALLAGGGGLGVLAAWRVERIRRAAQVVWGKGFRWAALGTFFGWLAWSIYALLALLLRPWSSSLPGWLIEYWTRPAFALALLGGALLSWGIWKGTKRPEALAPLAVNLILLALYSRHAQVTPLHPWAMRRLVPLVMPMLALSTSAAVNTLVGGGALLLGRWLPNLKRLLQWGASFAGLVLLVGLIYGIGQRTYPILWHREWEGLYGQLQALDARLLPSSVVLMGSGPYADQLAPTMQFLLEHPTFVLRHDDVVHSDSAVVDRLLRAIQASGRDIFYVATGEAYRPLPPGWALRPEGSEVIHIPILRYPWGRPPTAHDIVIETILADVYRVIPEALEAPPNAEETVAIPLGPGSYPYLREGLYAFEQPDGHSPYRWTDGRGVMTLPWPKGVDSATLCVEMDLSSGRPPQAPTPQVILEAEGKAVGQATLESAERRTLFFTAKDVQEDGDGRLTLAIVSDTWVPAQTLESADTRRLGVMLYGLTVHFDGACPAKE